MTRDLAERVARDIDRRLERLRDRIGSFPVGEETVENEPDFFEHGREMAESGWRGDAGAFVTDADDRALFIRHEGEPDRWGIPGGGHEPCETFAETARREVLEETGVEVALTGIWRARRRTFVHADEPDRRLEMLTVWFDAQAESTVLDVGDEEVLEARWFEAAPDAVHDEFGKRVAAWCDD